MRKIFLVIAIILSSMLGTAFAQGGQRMTVEERAKRVTDWMTTELGLSREQVTPVDSINRLFAKTQQLLFQSAEGDREKIRETMTALEQEKIGALSKILTATQLDSYKAKSKEMMERRKNRTQ